MIKTGSSWLPSLLDWLAHPGFVLFVCLFSCIILSLEMWWVAKEGKRKKDPSVKANLKCWCFYEGTSLKKKSYLLKDDRLLYSCKLFAPNWQSLAISSCDHCFVFLYLRMGWWWNGNVAENILSLDGTLGKDSQVLKRVKTHLTRACGTKTLTTTEQNKESKGPGLANGGWGSSRLLRSIVGSVENDPKMSQGWFGAGDLIPQLKCPLGKHGDLSL